MNLSIEQINLIIEAIDTRIQCWILLNLEKSEVQDLKDLRNKLMFDKIELQNKNKAE